MAATKRRLAGRAWASALVPCPEGCPGQDPITVMDWPKGLLEHMSCSERKSAAWRLNWLHLGIFSENMLRLLCFFKVVAPKTNLC